jgi:hypothetical protein
MLLISLCIRVALSFKPDDVEGFANTFVEVE